MKVKNIKTGAIKEVSESLVTDYLDTKEWQIYKAGGEDEKLHTNSGTISKKSK